MVPDAINGEAVQFAHRIFQTFSAYKLVRFLIFESLKDDLTRVECSPGETYAYARIYHFFELS